MRAAAVVAAFACALGALAPMGPACAADVVFEIVPARSHATFSVRHLYVQRVDGSVPIARGRITLEAGAIVPSHIDATLDPKRIDTHDADRDDDLQGPDWFDVQHFPTWTFTSTSIVAAPGGFTVTGSFTAHGVATPVTLAVTTMRGAARPTYHATATLDRHAFGMRVTPLDGTIGNELDLVLDIEAE